jgi:hypothetical protein
MRIENRKGHEFAPGVAGHTRGDPGGSWEGSRPVSRVLSWTAIHLGCASPRTSSDLPGNSCGPHVAAGAARSPIWSCSGWGLPCRRVLPPARCALTAPFHPCRPASNSGRVWRSVFCGTFRGLTPPRRYLAPCPSEPGLSSPRPIQQDRAASDCPADSPRNYMRMLLGRRARLCGQVQAPGRGPPWPCHLSARA